MIPPVSFRRIALLIRRGFLEFFFQSVSVAGAAVVCLFVVAMLVLVPDSALLLIANAFACFFFLLTLFAGAMAQFAEPPALRNANRLHDREMLPASRAEKHAAKFVAVAVLVPFFAWFFAAALQKFGGGDFFAIPHFREPFSYARFSGALAVYWILSYASFLLVFLFRFPSHRVLQFFLMPAFIALFVGNFMQIEFPSLWLLAGPLLAFPVWLSVCRSDALASPIPAKKSGRGKTPSGAFAFAVPERMNSARRIFRLLPTPEFRRMFYYCAGAIAAGFAYLAASHYLLTDGELSYGFYLDFYELPESFVLLVQLLIFGFAFAILYAARVHVFFLLPASRAEKFAAMLVMTVFVPALLFALFVFCAAAALAGEFNAVAAADAGSAVKNSLLLYTALHSAGLLALCCLAKRTKRARVEACAALAFSSLFLLFVFLPDFVAGFWFLFFGQFFNASYPQMPREVFMGGYGFVAGDAALLWRGDAAAAQTVSEFWRGARGFFAPVTPFVFWYLAWLRWQRG